MGRKTKLTRERLKKVRDALSLNATYRIAATYAGVAPKTLYRWRERGKTATRGIYRDLYLACREAEGEAAIADLATIRKAAKRGDWKAAAWMLERRYPEDYGRRQAIDVKAAVSASVDINATTARQVAEGLSDDALAELAAALPPEPSE